MIFKLFIILSLFLVTHSTIGKDKEPNPLDKVYAKIEQAYTMGWSESSPVDIQQIQQKLAAARELQGKRKKREFNKLVQQLNIDLKIIEVRHRVNQLNQKLMNEQNKNRSERRVLSNLKEQLK